MGAEVRVPQINKRLFTAILGWATGPVEVLPIWPKLPSSAGQGGTIHLPLLASFRSVFRSPATSLALLRPEWIDGPEHIRPYAR